MAKHSLKIWVDFGAVFSELILSTNSNFFVLNVICLETEAFYSLVEEVVTRIREKDQISTDKWISLEEAMELLRVTSKSTMQKLRDEGLIRFSQPYRKIILYDRDSILSYIETHVNQTH